MKQGIIIVNHGTMDSEVRSRTLDDFAYSISDRIPEADVVCVYTNGEVRKGLRETSDEKPQNLKAAILSMKKRGVSSLVIISTDIHDGDDYRKLKEETVGLAALFSDVSISVPLLYADKDFEVTARAMHGAFSELVGDDVLILITTGHKTDGAEELRSFETSLKKHINNGYVATLHGEKKLYKVIKELKQSGFEEGRVVFVPLEFMAGEGIENEVSQEYTDLVQKLTDEGYKVESIFKGLAEYDEFQRLYMRHFYDSMR